MRRALARLRFAGAVLWAEILVRRHGNVARVAAAVEAVVALGERSLDTERPHDAARLAVWANVLGSSYRELGDPSAEPTLQKALSLTRRAFGAMDPRVAVVLSNLGGVTRLLGRLDEAESFYLEALAIDRTAYANDHSETLTDRTNLALLHLQRDDASRNDRNQARAELEEILRIELRRYGPNHVHVANDRINMAGIFAEQGDWTSAEYQLREALRVIRTVAPECRVELGNTLSRLAHVLDSGGGDPDEALALHEEALAIHERELGPHHPDVAIDLLGVAVAKVRRGKPEATVAALASMERARRIDDQLLLRGFAVGSQDEQLRFASMLHRHRDLLLSLLVLRHLPRDVVARAGLDLVLRRKGVVLEVTAAHRDAILTGRYPELSETLRTLAALQTRITRHILAGSGRDTAGHADAARLRQWTREKESLERRLAERVPASSSRRTLDLADAETIARHLPPHSVLVEFVRCQIFDFDARGPRAEAVWHAARYLAFVLPAGDLERAAMIDLGSADEIDQLVDEYRIALASAPSPKDGGTTGAGPIVAGRDLGTQDRGEVEIGNDLRSRILDPLLPAMGARTRAILAPDGQLLRLPFEVLPLADGRRVIDVFELSYVTTGRDVLRFAMPHDGRNSGDPLVVANPDFDLAGSSPAPRSHAGHPSPLLANVRFGALPGTDREGNDVARMLQVEPRSGSLALKGCVTRLRSPRIMHFATHGFFVAEPIHAPPSTFPWRLAALHRESPLIRSGLALAGANTWLTGGIPADDAEEGLLTAADVTTLDLRGTELVVLSACETGLGEHQTGEGVFGLRRSFVLAGARSLIMSLWKVPDAATSELMAELYGELLAGRPRFAALRTAQLKIKARHPDPFSWGAFICEGDPSPLRGAATGP